MVRKSLAIAVVALLLAAAFGLHLYIIDRLVLRTSLVHPVAELLTTLVWVGLAAIVAHPLAERLLPRAIGRWISLVGTTWMGLVFWLLLALAVSDLFLVVGRELGFVGIGMDRARAMGVVVLVGAAVVVGGYNAWRGPRDVRVEIELAHWPRALDGYRIAQISDIHIGPALGRRFARELTRRVNALDADLVAVTGDLVDGRAHHLQDEVEPFSELSSRDGVFFVTGNHDHYSGANDWVDRVGELGMRALRNTSIRIERGEAGFTLAGVDDHRSKMMPGEGGEDLRGALDGISGDDATVQLAHDPATFKRAHAMGVDLQISGHTHGGQIWPFEYFVRLAVPFVAGRYRLGEAELYVSRGTGFWGPPLRLFAPAEITEIVLRAPAHASA